MNDQFRKDLELIKTDPEQFEAFRAKNNTVVIAGPGSGKTRVLTLKAVALAQMEIEKPAGLALISYSRETVREIKKRLKLYGYQSNGRDFIGTVHSFSLVHVIEPFGRLFPEYGIKYPLQLLPKDIETKIYNSVISEMQIDAKSLKLVEINRRRSLSQAGKSGIVITSRDIVSKAAEKFEEKLRETEFLDFPALINLSAKIIEEQEMVRNILRSRFPWLLIDEYQDLGKSLHEMVLELTLNAGIKLFAVGDMNQSIYGFNGGYPDFLDELKNNDDIHTISLLSNYRSSQHIITASLETLVPEPPVPEYISKMRQDDVPNFIFITCSDEMEPQYKVIAEKVIPKLIAAGTPRNEIGILMGSNDQVQFMAQKLSREGISFYISKWKFDNSTVVVWLQNCAAWCIEEGSQLFDELFRTWDRLLTDHNDARSFLDKIDRKKSFYKILNKSKSKETVYEWLSYVISELQLEDLLEGSERFPNENENLRTLINEAHLYNLKGTKLIRFANLGIPHDEVTVTTRHSAKGLEFEAVILVGMEEGKFPNHYALKDKVQLEESKRLCYVSVSRAKSCCILIRSEYYFEWEKRKPYAPSQYWNSLFQRFGNEENSFRDEDFF